MIGDPEREREREEIACVLAGLKLKSRGTISLIEIFAHRPAVAFCPRLVRMALTALTFLGISLPLEPHSCQLTVSGSTDCNTEICQTIVGHVNVYKVNQAPERALHHKQ
jgi:hypothetical protein